MENEMTKERVENILKETGDKVVYTEQIIGILQAAGYSFKNSLSVYKAYAKKSTNYIKDFESDIKKICNEQLANYIISKIQESCISAYSKSQEDAYLLLYKN